MRIRRLWHSKLQTETNEVSVCTSDESREGRDVSNGDSTEEKVTFQSFLFQEVKPRTAY